MCDPDRPRAPECCGFSPPSAALGLCLANFITVQGHQLHTGLLASPAPPAASTFSISPDRNPWNFLSMNSAILGSLYRSCPLCLDYVIPNHVVQVVACVGMESVYSLFCGTSPCGGPDWPCTVSAFRLHHTQRFLCKSYINTPVCI